MDSHPNVDETPFPLSKNAPSLQMRIFELQKTTAEIT